MGDTLVREAPNLDNSRHQIKLPRPHCVLCSSYLLPLLRRSLCALTLEYLITGDASSRPEASLGSGATLLITIKNRNDTRWRPLFIQAKKYTKLKTCFAYYFHPSNTIETSTFSCLKKFAIYQCNFERLMESTNYVLISVFWQPFCKWFQKSIIAAKPKLSLKRTKLGFLQIGLYS